jgi:membrane protein
VPDNAHDRLTQARHFLTEGIWLGEFEPQTWTNRGVRLLQFVYIVVEGFVRDHLLLRASALTYFSVLSIVPVLAIVGSVATAVGVTENVVGMFVERISARFPGAGETLGEIVANANIGGLGTLGAVTLFLTTVLGISNIERALNHIWGVKQDRSWGRRLPDYLAVLIIAPLLLGAGLSMATTIKSQWVVRKLLEFPGFDRAYDLGLQQLPTLVLAGAFTFLLWFMPNTRVRPFAAFLGGFVTAVGVNAALGLYVNMSVGAARANALYGGFAQLPLFFVWIYFFWAIVLFGAEVAFAYQNLDLYRREVRGRNPDPAEREAIGLRIVLEVGRAFRDGSRPWTAEALAETLVVPVRAVRGVIDDLIEKRILVALDGDDRSGGYQLGRPAEQIDVTLILSALRGEREPAAADDDVRRAVDRILAEVGESEAKGAGSQTLADVLAGLPASPDPS